MASPHVHGLVRTCSSRSDCSDLSVETMECDFWWLMPCRHCGEGMALGEEASRSVAGIGERGEWSWELLPGCGVGFWIET